VAPLTVARRAATSSEIGPAERIGAARAPGRRQRAKARGNLVSGKGLGQVVIDASVEAGHAFGQSPARGEREHGRQGRASPPLQPFQAVSVRQSEIKDNGIISGGGQGVSRR
jgi:hypothetical protein